MVDEASPGFDPARFEIELDRRGVSTSGPELEREVQKELSNPTPVRLWAVAKAFELGMDVSDVHRLTSIDRWFLAKLHGLHQLKVAMRRMDYYDLKDQPALLREAGVFSCWRSLSRGAAQEAKDEEEEEEEQKKKSNNENKKKQKKNNNTKRKRIRRNMSSNIS